MENFLKLPPSLFPILLNHEIAFKIGAGVRGWRGVHMCVYDVCVFWFGLIFLR